MARLLVLCEKPKVAASIAAALGVRQRRDGYYEGKELLITWAYGHLLELADAEEYDERYRRWNLDDLPIIPSPFRRRPRDRKAAEQLRLIRELMRRPDVEAVVNACDAGREGELIFRTIYQYCRCTKPVLRLWISSQTPEAIREGMRHLRPGSDYDMLAEEAFSRQEADWLVGINATRAYSVRNGAKVVIGRVQTPTLALIVRRELEIRNFVPQTYYVVRARFRSDAGEYEGTWFRGDEDRLDVKEQAEAIARKVQGRHGTVVSVEERERQEPPPLLFDLTSLQQHMNKTRGFTAARTLDVLQELYETHKLVTYPRTDSKHLGSDVVPRLKTLLRACQPLFPAEVESLLALPKLPVTSRIVDDAKVTDHHAIVPTGVVPDLSRLSADERAVLEEVARRFVAAFMPPYRYRETVVVTQVEGETFRTRGRQPIQEGWRALYAKQRDGGEEEEGAATLPPLRQGTGVTVLEVHCLERQTQPPARYTEATLLQDMERAGRFLESEDMREVLKGRGLGTPATRAEIIEKLVEYGYVVRRKRTLLPTETGMALIQGLTYRVLTSPELTAEWEQKLAMIRSGAMTRQEFMRQVVELTRDIVEHARREGTILGIAGDATDAVGRCPRCGSPVREFPKAYACTRRECGTVIWKRIAGKAITRRVAATLLEKGETGLLKGFKSRSGKPFNARLRLTGDGKVEFVFS